MNFEKLKKNIGFHVQLVPIASRLDENNNQLPVVDDDWIMQEVREDSVRLQNLRTHHTALLGKDHVHHFTSNPARNSGGIQFGFLTLNVQVFMQEAKLWVKPNSGPGKPVAPSGDSPPSIVEKQRLMDERLARVLEFYRESGNPQPIIDTFIDMTAEEKADMYDRVVLLKRKRPPRSNPYRNG